MTIDSKNIVLTGPSGSGKSTVGRILAKLLSRSLLDMDGEIERRLGCSISECFATRGEAVFRDMESALCRELSQRGDLVVASGGGVLVRPENRAELEANAVLVNLSAPVDDLAARLEGHGDRPLLGEDSDALKRKLSTLVEQRKALYDAVPVQIDTRNLSPEQVAQEIVARLSELDAG